MNFLTKEVSGSVDKHQEVQFNTIKPSPQAPPQGVYVVDSRDTAQLKLMDMIQLAGSKTPLLVDNRDTSQIRLMKAIQRMEMEEEELQMKPVTQLQSEDEELLQGKFETIQQKPNNTGLPNNLKSGIENISGFSMDDVQVHYNSDKPAQIQAHAYAPRNPAVFTAATNAAGKPAFRSGNTLMTGIELKTFSSKFLRSKKQQQQGIDDKKEMLGSLYQWMLGNLLPGPAPENRPNDGGDEFDDKAATIQGNEVNLNELNNKLRDYDDRAAVGHDLHNLIRMIKAEVVDKPMNLAGRWVRRLDGKYVAE